MDQVILASSIIAVTEVLKRLLPQAINGWVTIVVAAVLGILAGFAGISGVNWFSGLLIGLAAAGGVRVFSSK